jgi:predicted site-specific integrase-resolvase
MNAVLPPKGMIDLTAAAERFQIRKEIISRCFKEGLIKGKQIGNRIFIEPDSVRSLMEASGRAVPEVAA